MNTQRLFHRLLSWVVCVPFVLASPAHAQLAPLSNTPLFLGGNVSPNVMFALDDSGSMHWEVMPDSLMYVNYMFPRVVSGIYGSGDYANQSADFDPTNQYTTLLRSSHNNKIYYDPAVVYEPWSNADGSLMPNATPTCAPYTPMNTGLGCRNLTVNNTETASYRRNNGSIISATDTFHPAVYFNYIGGIGGDIRDPANYTQVQIISTTPSYPRAPSRTDCGTGATCTYAQEIQNFANWYTYYRSRILLARAGVGKAFAAQGNNMRVGFAAINKGSTTIDGIATSVVQRGVRQFSGTDRTNFFSELYGHPMPTSGTPLRTALHRIGQYYERTDNNGPWGEFPGTGGGTQHACRQSYTILMTDGYWNDSFSSVGNADGTAGSSITNHRPPPNDTPASLAYAPIAPYMDGWSNTLADVAMYYWKRDLRTDLDNKVPTNSADPAFWQHMSTFTAGLGVSGTLPPPPAAPGAWPNPTLGDGQKLDDLWHAAVNGRGDFFSAANPTEFANGLSLALTSINARTGSASAVAANSSSLQTDGRVYQAKFNAGDWSGQLLSFPIDQYGVIGVGGVSSAFEWDAGALMDPITIAPVSRVIITKGATDGVAFEYANLSATQQGLLDKNAAGITDNCGAERVAYLRGDGVNEGVSGTFVCGGNTIDKFRSRAVSKLGDIVSSGPFYVGAPSAGLSDEDHPGYGAFSGVSSGYAARMPVVYVGSNDGSLHGFNACVVGVHAGCSAAVAGKELIAYVPSMVHANLSKLTDKNYNLNHRYFVDGSPMVADANLGTAGLPRWASVLVGSMNSGGQGYFALDVSNPNILSRTAPTFDASNAASLLLWEFSSADDSDMGYTHNLPPIDPFTSQARQIVKMENGKWAVIVGNGYNSTAGQAVLYVLFIADGEDGVWTVGSDYIKIVADVGSGNGLSTPMPFDADGDGLADVIYAGDLKGNMWKFNVSSATPASWSKSLLYAAGTGKAITSPPVITAHPNGGQLVLFGTGRYLETGDVTSTGTQTMYGIWDTGAVVTTGQLVAQTGTVLTIGTVKAVTTTQNPVNYSTSTPVVKGWFLDFPTSGERLTGVPSLEYGRLTLNTIIPSTSPCDFGGDGYVYLQDYLTGTSLLKPSFDTSGDGSIGVGDVPVAGISIGFALGGVTRVRGTTQDVLLSSPPDGSAIKKTPNPPPPLGSRGRIDWRELIQ